MEGRGKFLPALFSKDFFAAGFTPVPNLLLKYSSRLGLGGMELAVILVFFYFQQTGKTRPEPSDFAEILNITEKQAKKVLEGLMAQGFFKETEDDLDPAGLFEKIADLYFEEKVKAFQTARGEGAGRESAVIAPKTAGNVRVSFFNSIVQAFEQEFGRPLTPMECDQIKSWYKDDGYSEELILEALKRAVLRGVLNFTYVNRILAHWAKNNLRTAWEVNQYEEKYLRQRQLRKGQFGQEKEREKEKADKYKDLYLS